MKSLKDSECFRRLRYKPDDRHMALIAKLKEYATRWLKSRTQGESAIVAKILLEQVYTAMPGRICTGEGNQRDLGSNRNDARAGAPRILEIDKSPAGR